MGSRNLGTEFERIAQHEANEAERHRSTEDIIEIARRGSMSVVGDDEVDDALKQLSFSMKQYRTTLGQSHNVEGPLSFQSSKMVIDFCNEALNQPHSKAEADLLQKIDRLETDNLALKEKERLLVKEKERVLVDEKLHSKTEADLWQTIRRLETDNLALKESERLLVKENELHSKTEADLLQTIQRLETDNLALKESERLLVNRNMQLTDEKEQQQTKYKELRVTTTNEIQALTQMITVEREKVQRNETQLELFQTKREDLERTIRDQLQSVQAELGMTNKSIDNLTSGLNTSKHEIADHLKNLRSTESNLGEAQDKIAQLKRQFADQTTRIQELMNTNNEQRRKVKESEEALVNARAETTKQEEVGKDLQSRLTRIERVNARFELEVLQISGVSEDTCWPAFSRLGLLISGASLNHQVPNSLVQFDISLIYGLTPKRFSSTSKVGRISLQILLSLQVNRPAYRASKLWGLWHSWETSLSHSSRQELYWPLFSLIKIIFSSPNSSNLEIWLACQLGCSLLQTAPSNLDMRNLFPRGLWLESVPADTLVIAGLNQLQASDQRRSHSEQHDHQMTIFQALCALDSTEGPIARFRFFRDSQPVEAFLVLLSGYIMVVAELADETNLIWHTTTAACSFYIAQLFLWFELRFDTVHPPEILAIEGDSQLNGEWLNKNGIQIINPTDLFRQRQAGRGLL